MNKLYYLAYGSNLHPHRLIKRGISANPIGKVELTNTKIVFHKRSIDYSGKCMIVDGEKNNVISYGFLYEIAAKDEMILDKLEGYGNGYTKKLVNCPVESKEYKAYTYVAESKAIDESLKPYHWYKQLVVIGAKYHSFPNEYISALESIESMYDPDTERRSSYEIVIDEIEKF